MKKTILASVTLAIFAMTSQTAVANGDCYKNKDKSEATTETASETKSNNIIAERIFGKKCKVCHSLTKKKFGPAFNSMNKDTDILLTTITNGGKSMPKFKKKLSSDEIAAMVKFIQDQ